jgi:hypothetical protein
MTPGGSLRVFFLDNTQNCGCFGSDFSNTQTRRFFGSDIFKCLLGQQFFYSDFFFKYVEPTKIEGPPHNRYLSMLGGYQKMAENRAKFQAGFKSNTSEYSPESYPVGNLFIVSENRSLEIMSLLIYN